MKRLFVSFLSLSLLLVSCSFSKSSTTPTSDPFNIPWDDRSTFKEGLVQSQQAALDKLPGASIYHLDLKVAEDLYHVTGTEEVQYTNTETVALDEVQFRLFPNVLGGEMTISNLSVDGQTVSPEYSLEKSLMIVPLPEPLEPSQSTVLKMDFSVTVPQDVEDSYGVLAYYDGVLALAHAYPMICVYDDEGWNAELPAERGDITYGDAAFFLARVTAPAELTLVMSGREISRNETDQLQSLTVANGPARDFILVASPDYVEQSQTLGDVTIHSYAPRDLQAGGQFALETATQALEVFSERYAPYPYTELDIATTPNTALGIEYPGLIVIATRIYDLEQDSPDNPVRAIMEGTVAHEVGHQWFYNLVGDDQLDDPWLDESLTQFATLQYYSDRYGSGGEEGFRSSLENRWGRVDFAEVPIGLPVASYSGQEYGAIVYGRGALFFEALREQIGEETFNSFLKDYAATYSWGIATPEGLRSIAEMHCTCDLQPIFNEWVYQN